jgi:UDP-2,3-diacylglucosamine pyrophosphatase LpxH
MKTTQLLILSDIHLERVSDIKQNFLLSTINEKISSIKSIGKEPVIVFAGDVHNSTKGYGFLSKINAKVIYIAGNHEFWEDDYYEVIKKLQSEAPSNVTFLHNDITHVGDYIILGATMWTDVGQNLNKDLLLHSATRMNDMSFITAKKWYESPENIEKLETLYSGYEIKEKIKSQKWNALIEIEENAKSWDFLSLSNDVFKAIYKAEEINSRLEKDLVNKHEWWRIDKKVFQETQEKIKLTGSYLTWTRFIENLATLYKNYNISEEEKVLLLTDANKKDVLFQKIREIPNFSEKEIVILSHHLPFYEEILVGNLMLENNNVEPRLHNPIDPNIFLIRQGQDYPDFNYLLRASKGDIERHKDITHIVNYYNDGANKIDNFLLENTKIWIHGHEHHFRYRDYVKGIQIVTNPSGSSLSVLEQIDGELKINRHYCNYYKIKDENHEQELMKIKNSLVMEPGEILAKENLQETVRLWALKTYNWKEHLKIIKKIEQAARQILILSVEYVQREDSANEKIIESLSSLEDRLGVWTDSYNYNYQKLIKMHEDLILAFSVRVEKKFNFQLHYTKSMMTMLDVYSWTMGNVNWIEPLTDGVTGVFGAKKAFEAKGNIKLSLKYVEKITNFLDTIDIKHIYQVQSEHLNKFNDLSKQALNRTRVSEKIEEKWEVFYKKNFESSEENSLDNDF